MDSILKGSLYTAAAAIIWGGAPIVEKAAMDYVNPVVMGAWRYFIAGFMIFVYLRSRRVNMDISRLAGRRLFLASVLGAALLPALFYTGLFLTDPITASSISNIGVVWVGLFGMVFLKEKIRADELAGTLLVVIGVWIMLNKISFGSSVGAFMLIAASIVGAAAAVMERKSLLTVNPWIVSLYDRLVGGSVSLIASLFFVGSGAVLLSAQAWSYLLFLAVFASLIPALLFFYGLRLIEAERSAAILSTAPLFTVIFTSVFTNSSVTQNQFAGAVIIVAGVLILSASRKLITTMKHYTAIAINHEVNSVKKLRYIFSTVEGKDS
ncbi:MAG: DMT family transporter [Candidatus Aenigmarchaeota archaeon]|nr:DMT family transporter [Candidatus Aenigmarchaeota archaeon]